MQLSKLVLQPISFFTDVRRFRSKFANLVILHVVNNLASKDALQGIEKTVLDPNGCNIIDEGYNSGLEA